MTEQLFGWGVAFAMLILGGTLGVSLYVIISEMGDAIGLLPQLWDAWRNQGRDRD